MQQDTERSLYSHSPELQAACTVGVKAPPTGSASGQFLKPDAFNSISSDLLKERE